MCPSVVCDKTQIQMIEFGLNDLKVCYDLKVCLAHLRTYFANQTTKIRA